MTTFSKIRFGSGLSVTDEGGGVITVSAGASSAGSYADAILAEPSLVAYWPLNESSGDALDASGNSHDLLAGSFGGAPARPSAGPFPADPTQTAYTFDGDDYLAATTDAALDAYGGTGVTAEAWVYPTAYDVVGRYITQSVGGTGSGATEAFDIQLNASHHILWQAANTASVASPGTVPLNTWVHVVGTYSPTDGIRLYLDGAEVASAAGTAPLTNLTTTLFRIGANHEAVYLYPFKGRIAQVALYTTALSAAAIAGHYSAAAPPDAPVDISGKVDRDAVEAATARLVQVKLASGDTQPAFKITGDGKIQWGPGGTTAPDTTLARQGAGHIRAGGILSANSQIYANADDAADLQVWVGQYGGNAPEPAVTFGSDTYIRRTAASKLATNGAFVATKLAAGLGADLTVTANAVTVANGFHRILTNAGAANLTTINGGADGELLTLINRTGANFSLAGGGNIIMPVSPMAFLANAAQLFVFDPAYALWQLVG